MTTLDDLLQAGPFGPVLDMPIDGVLNFLGLQVIPPHGGANIPVGGGKGEADTGHTPRSSTEPDRAAHDSIAHTSADRSTPASSDSPGSSTAGAFDITTLIKPVLELLASFGTGNLGGTGGGAMDGLSTLSNTLGQSMDAVTQAVSSVSDAWTGLSGAANVAETAGTEASTAGLVTQSGAMRIDLAAAAGIVAQGAALLQAVVAKFIGIAAATGPAIWTPAGQAALIAAAGDALTEAGIIVATTRAELLAPTAHVAAAGAPVTVAAPADPTSLATILSAAQAVAVPLIQAATQLATTAVETGVSTVSTVAQAALPDADTATRPAATVPVSAIPSAATASPTPFSSAPSGAPGGLGTTGAPSSTVAAALPPAHPVAARPNAGPVTESAPTAARESRATLPMAMIPPLMGQRSTESAHDTPDFLITEANSDALVGDSAELVPSVFGATPTEEPA